MSRWWIYVLAAPAVALFAGMAVSLFRIAQEAEPQTRSQRIMLRWNRFNALLLPAEALSERGQLARRQFGRFLGAFLTVAVAVAAIALALNGCVAALTALG